MTPSAASPRKERVIVWFRRDLRVADNPALAAALQMAKEVIPVFIWAPEEEGQFQPGRCLRWWLHSSLRAFEEDLAALGSRMVYAKAAESRFALAELVRELGAQAVLFNHLYDPISMVRDNEVKATLAAAGVFCQSFNADILREPWEVLDGSGQPFTCFEDFWNAHCSLPYPPPPPLPVAARLPPVAKDVGALSLGELGMMLPEEEMSNVQLEYHWTPGGAGAHEILAGFLSKRLQLFDRDRAKTDRASTSRLSPHIHCGEISVRYIYYVAKQKEAEWASRGEGGSSVADFLRQVGYREYSRYLSFHFPFTHERSLLEHLRAVPWKFDQRLFKAWRQGRTGYPLVDAGMRELWSTGWIHNRIRVVCASFMVKNLLLPWQWGLKHYWDAQLDADLESDALGWQYCAGCMADAHDFSYMIDLGTESKRFDPDGNYVRRWLPVLARLPAKYIHTPWEAPMQILDDAGVELGVNYPLPVISEQQAAEDLAKAHAIVLQCQRGEEGCGEVGGSADYAAGVAAGAADISWPRGPFRPPTEPPPLGLGERLWGDRDDYGAGGVVPMFEGPGHGGAVAGGMSAAVFGASGRRRRSLEAADSAQASEDVQSNVVVCDDMSEVRAPPLRPQQATASIAPPAGPVAVGRRLPRPGNRGSPPRAAAAAATGLLAAEPWPSPVARAGTGGTSGGDGNRATATDYRVPSLSAGPSGARVPDSAAGAMPQSSTEAAQQAYSARGQGATSPWNGGVGTTGVPLSSGHTVVLRHSAGQSSWGEAGSALPPAAKRDVAAPSQEGSPGVSRPQSKRQRSVDYAGLKVMAATAAVDAGDGTGVCNSTADRGRDR